VPRLLERAGLRVDDIDLWEINEAFASQALYCRDFLGIDNDKLNVNGGSISIGHPFGMTGARMTGHLLIATLHTNDAAGAITRLTEMGIEPFNVSASLIGVLAQRLVRRVCTDCRVEYTPEPDVLRRLGMTEDETKGKTLYRGVGCETCGGSGYNGRYGIHELLVVDDDIEGAIVREASALELRDLAVEKGMKTLRQDGIYKAFQGVTTLEEVLARTAD
jgi:type IV pilus assembly protein PilB